MKKISIFLLVVVCFSACYNPEEPQADEFHITGRVLTYGTNEPVAGAIVWATECEGVVNFGDPCIVRTVATDTTDTEGRYELDATGFGIEVGATKANYDSRNTEKSVDSGGGERKIDIVIQPYAWLDITIKNKSGTPRLDFEASYPTSIFLPKDSTTRAFAQVGGNANKIIKMGVFSVDGKYIRRYDTLYCRGLDTIFHYIEY